MSPYWSKSASLNIFVKLVERVSQKGWSERAAFVYNASQRPNIRFLAIGLIPPDLRAGIVRRPGLCLHQFLVGEYFGDIEISYFVYSIADEDIGAFHIAM
jgi:hypothetical protein